MGQILWQNHLIKFNGKYLDFIHWAQCGLITIADVLQDYKLCPNKMEDLNHKTLYNIMSMHSKIKTQLHVL